MEVLRNEEWARVIPSPDGTSLPFFDDFEAVIVRPEYWTGVDGADVWISGINEPSGLVSMRLDATNPGGDEARYASGQLWVLDGGLSAQVQQMRV